MKEKLILVGSVLVGLLAFWLTHRYIQAERAKLYAGAETVYVIKADRDLPAGATLKIEDLGKDKVFKAGLSGQAITPDDVGLVLGKKLKYALVRGDVLQWSFVDLPDRFRGGLAPTIRQGMRAVSLGIGGTAAVSGLVQPNDRVDILGTFTLPSKTVTGQMETVTLTILQDVTVLATGQRLGKADPVFGGAAADRPVYGYSSVTFEVTPEEAELLVFTEHMKGQLSLTLRNPEDPRFIKTEEVNFQRLETRLPTLNQFRQETVRGRKTP